MYSLSSIRRGRAFSASSLLRSFGGLKWVSQFSSQSGGFPGSLDNSRGSSFPENVAAVESAEHKFPFLGKFERNLGANNAEGNISAPYASSFQRFIGGRNDAETGRNSWSVNFVRGTIEEDGRRYNIEHDADFVHIKLLRNNTFVTVTDSKGNIKCGASSGCLPELKGGPKLSRYAAEATAEHVGRQAKNLGLKSVVMKVNGFTHFKKKRQAIMSFKEGFTNSRSDQNPIVYIEDTTRKPHNGCRLPKKRRV